MSGLFFSPTLSESSIKQYPSLQQAAVAGDLAAVGAMLDKGTDLLTTDQNGETALDAALRVRDDFSVKFEQYVQDLSETIFYLQQMMAVKLQECSDKLALLIKQNDVEEVGKLLDKLSCFEAGRDKLLECINKNIKNIFVNNQYELMDKIYAFFVKYPDVGAMLEFDLIFEFRYKVVCIKDDRSAPAKKLTTQLSDLMGLLLYVRDGILNKEKEVQLFNANHNHLVSFKYFYYKKPIGHTVDTYKDENGMTSLQMAANFGYFDMVRFIVDECNPDLELEDNSRQTALYHSIQSKRFEIMKFLIENGAQVNRKDQRVCAALFLAAQVGSFAMVEFLVEQTDANVLYSRSVAKMPQQLQGQTLRTVVDSAQARAAELGGRDEESNKIYYYLLEKYLLRYYERALGAAIAVGNDEERLNNAVAGLMSLDAGRKRLTDILRPWLAMAEKKLICQKIFEFMRQNNFKLTELTTSTQQFTNANQPLVALVGGQVKQVVLSVKKFDTYNQSSCFDKQDKLILQQAQYFAAVGRLEVAKEMTANQQPRGLNYMKYAACVGDVGLLKQLIAVGIDVNCRSDYQRTALIMATVNGRLSAVKYLLEEVGAKDELTDSFGGSARCYALDPTYYIHSKVTEYFRARASTAVQAVPVKLTNVKVDRSAPVKAKTTSDPNKKHDKKHNKKDKSKPAKSARFANVSTVSMTAAISTSTANSTDDDKTETSSIVSMSTSTSNDNTNDEQDSDTESTTSSELGNNPFSALAGVFPPSQNAPSKGTAKKKPSMLTPQALPQKPRKLRNNFQSRKPVWQPRILPRPASSHSFWKSFLGVRKPTEADIRVEHKDMLPPSLPPSKNYQINMHAPFVDFVLEICCSKLLSDVKYEVAYIKAVVTYSLAIVKSNTKTAETCAQQLRDLVANKPDFDSYVRDSIFHDAQEQAQRIFLMRVPQAHSKPESYRELLVDKPQPLDKAAPALFELALAKSIRILAESDRLPDDVRQCLVLKRLPVDIKVDRSLEELIERCCEQGVGEMFAKSITGKLYKEAHSIATVDQKRGLLRAELIREISKLFERKNTADICAAIMKDFGLKSLSVQGQTAVEAKQEESSLEMPKLPPPTLAERLWKYWGELRVDHSCQRQPLMAESPAIVEPPSP